MILHTYTRTSTLQVVEKHQLGRFTSTWVQHPASRWCWLWVLKILWNYCLFFQWHESFQKVKPNCHDVTGCSTAHKPTCIISERVQKIQFSLETNWPSNGFCYFVHITPFVVQWFRSVWFYLLILVKNHSWQMSCVFRVGSSVGGKWKTPSSQHIYHDSVSTENDTSTKSSELSHMSDTLASL